MMDKLKSEQDKLCKWLSSDPDYILNEFGDILSRNEFREVENQSDALDKMRMLLKIIIQKGSESCQSFWEILKEHQVHYPQVQQLFHPNTAGSSTPTVVADCNSVVTVRDLTLTNAKSLNMKIETAHGPGSSSSGNIGGQVPYANYTALGGSVICADKITGVNVGDIDLSVCVNTPHKYKCVQVRAGTVDETLPPSQGRAVKMIIEHKVELIDCLKADHSFILQHLHAKHIITDRQYHKIKHISLPETTVTDLIDQVIGNGQKSCSDFLEVLKLPDVLETYPQLKQITNKLR